MSAYVLPIIAINMRSVKNETISQGLFIGPPLNHNFGSGRVPREGRCLVIYEFDNMLLETFFVNDRDGRIFKSSRECILKSPLHQVQKGYGLDGHRFQFEL